ncbi:MAG: hypothetical protein GBAus27B_000506 [Mycoplasmataceae bacterium]|nr:MAG: hypothetical protein GBAus27B_000506 [Mycoplasmataceae bacterium]
MEPITAATIGQAIMTALKFVVKELWGYAKKAISTLWDNALTITIAGTSSGLFIYYYNMLYQWFAFAPLLNITILGIFALLNFSWVVSNWKSAPNSPSGDSNSGLNVRTGN